MDERVFRPKVGRPIPPWEAEHRLPLTEAVGPEVADRHYLQSQLHLYGC